MLTPDPILSAADMLDRGETFAPVVREHEEPPSWPTIGAAAFLTAVIIAMTWTGGLF